MIGEEKHALRGRVIIGGSPFWASPPPANDEPNQKQEEIMSLVGIKSPILLQNPKFSPARARF